jgi:DNA-directed RNA polymerase subunit RPC12/RpoP
MKEAPRPPRRSETFELECWRCKRTIEITVHETPHRCGKCGALLVIQWREREKQ